MLQLRCDALESLEFGLRLADRRLRMLQTPLVVARACTQRLVLALQRLQTRDVTLQARCM